jgi:hypothetical protein
MVLRVGLAAAMLGVVGACDGRALDWRDQTGTGGGGGRGGQTVAGVAGASGRAGVTGVGGSTAVTGRGGSTGVAGAGVAGVGFAGASGAAGAAGGGECAPRVLLQGDQTLIASFVVDEGVIAVLSDRVTLVGRDAQIITSVPFARQITAAAFDGTTLVIADSAAITVMSRSLDVGPSGFVTEACVSGVLVSGMRFVCGPENDWDRIFYTYDVGATAPVQIAMSAPYTYNGTPMRRVPGTDDFITVTTNQSPSDFHLYRVDATGKAVYVNESPYHGDFAATVTYAFDGAPAAHLVQVAGLMLKIYGDGCNTTMNSFNTGCFLKDGAIGTLRTGESFVGLADDAAGTLFAVVAAGGNFSDSPCQAGCAFQRIDVATRAITSQKTHAFSNQMYAAVSTAGDPKCGNIIVGFSVASASDPFTAKGFTLQSFDY